MKPHVLISGGTGLIGSHLSQLLISKGYQVTLLSRQLRSLTGLTVIRWDPEKKSVADFQLNGPIAIINLAGENLSAKPWTDKQKRLIVKSRTDSLDLIQQIVRDKKDQIVQVISTSAIGYYGTYTSSAIFEEHHSPGEDFLAKTCVKWEESIHEIARLDVPASWVRTGVVLSNMGGALKAIMGSMRTGFALPLGSGKQWVPWIHIRDIIGIYAFLLEHPEMTGGYNGVAPAFHSNKDLTRTIARVKKKIFLPLGVPGFLLHLILGEMASISLHGSRVSAKKIQNAGYQFQYTDLEEAIRSFEG